MAPAKVRQRISRVRIVAFIAIIAGVPVLGAGLASGATKVEPVFIDGNPSCADVNPAWTELKIEPVSSQTKSDGTLTVTITVHGNTFDWTSNIGVDAVIVKGGPNANLYRYDPPAEATSDAGLHSPFNDSSNDWYGLSHISFCYDTEAPSESPSPSVSSTVTPSGSPSESPSPTVSATITPSGSPSESPSPTVSATVTETASPSESASVLPTIVSASPSASVLAERVARTGISGINDVLTTLGVLMVLFGLVLFVVSSIKLNRIAE